TRGGGAATPGRPVAPRRGPGGAQGPASAARRGVPLAVRPEYSPHGTAGVHGGRGEDGAGAGGGRGVAALVGGRRDGVRAGDDRRGGAAVRPVPNRGQGG